MIFNLDPQPVRCAACGTSQYEDFAPDIGIDGWIGWVMQQGVLYAVCAACRPVVAFVSEHPETRRLYTTADREKS